MNKHFYSNLKQAYRESKNLNIKTPSEHSEGPYQEHKKLLSYDEAKIIVQSLSISSRKEYQESFKREK